MKEHSRALFFILSIMVLVILVIAALYIYEHEYGSKKKAIQLVRSSTILKGPENVDTKIGGFLKHKTGPLEIFGWNVEKTGKTGDYLVSFTFDEGFGREGFYFEVLSNKLVRYINGDSLLETSYNLTSSSNPQYRIDDSIRAAEISDTGVVLLKLLKDLKHYDENDPKRIAGWSQYKERELKYRAAKELQLRLKEMIPLAPNQLME